MTKSRLQILTSNEFPDPGMMVKTEEGWGSITVKTANWNTVDLVSASGSRTVNYLSKWGTPDAITNSGIWEDGTTVGLGFLNLITYGNISVGFGTASNPSVRVGSASGLYYINPGILAISTGGSIRGTFSSIGLDILGRVSSSTLRMTTGAAYGYVLTSDASGNATWQLPTGGGSMVYPGAGIAVSNGSGWGASIVDNSANWNTAYSWGNHALAGYQAQLVSGTNIKTINGNSLLGSGNIVIGSGGEMVYPGAGIPVSNGSEWGTSIVDNSANWNTAYTHSQAAHAPSNAQQNVQSDWSAISGDSLIINKPDLSIYQATLVSGTNIKTINGNSLLGSGDIIIGSGGEMVYPGAGIPVSTGSAWGTSIVDNSANWNTAYTHSQAVHAPSNAQQNVQSDWDATSGDAFILNKPTSYIHANGAASGLTVPAMSNTKITGLTSSVYSGITLSSNEFTVPKAGYYYISLRFATYAAGGNNTLSAYLGNYLGGYLGIGGEFLTTYLFGNVIISGLRYLGSGNRVAFF